MTSDDRADLIMAYERWQRDMRCGDWKQANLTAPLLVDPTERFLSAECRILFVGQETRGWGWAARTEHIERARLTNAVPEDIWELGGFLTADDGVEAMLAAYRALAFARYDGITRRSPFWSAFRRFDEVPDQAALWTNLCRSAFETDSGSHSIYRLKPLIRDAFVGMQSWLALEEFRILRPNACLFMTGRLYDPILTGTFPGLRFEPVEGYVEGVLARVIHPALPKATYRTYHPAYLRWQQLTEEILGKLEGLIGSP